MLRDEGGREMPKWIVDNGFFEAAVMLMDAELRDEVHAELAPCSELEFLECYFRKHREKYGIDFVV